MKMLALFGSVALLVILDQSPSVERNDKIDFRSVTCPISGQQVRGDISVEYFGKRLYFCCNGCTARVERGIADEDFHARFRPIFLHQLLQTKQIVEVCCPMSKKELTADSATELTVEKTRLVMCCEDCKTKASKFAGREAIYKLFSDVNCFSFQDKCPVKNRRISPQTYWDHGKRRVYFCSDDCRTAYMNAPRDFERRLPEIPKVNNK